MKVLHVHTEGTAYDVSDAAEKKRLQIRALVLWDINALTVLASPPILPLCSHCLPLLQRMRTCVRCGWIKIKQLEAEERKRQCCVSSYILIRHSFITSPKLWQVSFCDETSTTQVLYHSSRQQVTVQLVLCSMLSLGKVGLTLLPLKIGVWSRALHTVGAWYTFQLMYRYWATETLLISPFLDIHLHSDLAMEAG